MSYYIGIVTGAIVLIGALLILGLGKQVYVNAQGEVIDFEVPILGKIKTRSPLIFFACLGFTLIITCSKMAPAPTQELIEVDGEIDGNVDSATPVTVYFVAEPRAHYDQRKTGPIHTVIPKLPNDLYYRAEFVVGDKVVDEKQLKVVEGRASLALFTSDGAAAKNSQKVVPQVKTSDAEAKDFLKQ